MTNTEKFSGLAEVYTQYRPTYPKEFIDYLYNEVGLTSDSVIADIGSGTGKLSKELLAMGSKVICVEPNADMRFIAERELSIYPNFISIGASAEETTLADGSVDFITVAQAFHWFDKDSFKLECRRILRSSGKVIIVYNTIVNDENVIGGQVSQKRDKIYMRLCPNFHGRAGGIATEGIKAFESFFNNDIYETRVIRTTSAKPLENFVGGSLSASYAPKEGEENYEVFVCELTELFNKFSVDGVVTLSNDTSSYVGEV